jgi:hypothetical protein
MFYKNQSVDLVQRKHNCYRTTFTGLDCAFLQQTVVTCFGEGPEPSEIMGSKAFHFAITLCCLMIPCELLRAGILQRNLLLFGKSENPEMRRKDISVKK